MEKTKENLDEIDYIKDEINRCQKEIEYWEEKQGVLLEKLYDIEGEEDGN